MQEPEHPEEIKHGAVCSRRSLEANMSSHGLPSLPAQRVGGRGPRRGIDVHVRLRLRAHDAGDLAQTTAGRGSWSGKD